MNLYLYIASLHRIVNASDLHDEVTSMILGKQGTGNVTVHRPLFHSKWYCEET